jgi:uncharacterized membrane protein YhaH (DUF805 family)
VTESRSAQVRRVDWGACFFDSAGRVGRIGFVLKAAALIAGLAIYDEVAHGEVHVLTGWLVEWPLFFAGACILSQRLHDRGLSGWWGAPILLAFCLAWPRHGGVVGLFALLMLTVAAVALAILPGEPRFNRYGVRT